MQGRGGYPLKVRLGYVAMSVHVQNASPSKTMTYAQFSKISDREAALRKLEQIASENLHNTLRLLKHNRYSGIQLYRFSSRLIPLHTHEALKDWEPMKALLPQFKEIGDFVKKHQMRVSFHPDHYTVLSTPRKDVLQKSIQDLQRHADMLDAMGLGLEATCNIHVGGMYGDREKAMARFIEQFEAMDERIKQRMTLENDDKTFTASETLTACEQLAVPMVLDLHHHRVNPSDEDLAELWPRIRDTWNPNQRLAGNVNVPPKIHISSPKSAKDPRSHADYVDPEDLFPFLAAAADGTPAIDVMIEAKKKDDALFRLMEHAKTMSNVRVLTQASFEIG